MLSVLAPDERAVVLDRLVAAHPDLAEQAEQLAAEVLGDVTVDEVADEVVFAVEALDLDDLASRAGRIPGRGYVHETEAAYELVEEVVRPFVGDLERRARLGLGGAARAVALGTISGLFQCVPVSEGTVLAYAGEESPKDLADWVYKEAAHAGIDLPADQLSLICPDWSFHRAPPPQGR